MAYVSFAERTVQLMKRPTFLSIATMMILVIGIVMAHGQLGKVFASILNHGDIPPGDRCAVLAIDQGATVQTDKTIAGFAQLVANDPTNVDKLVRVSVEKYGDTLTHNDLPQVCGSIDGTQVATLDSVNLGR